MFEFSGVTKKQVNVIFAAAKREELKIERWVISEFYDVASYSGYDDNGAAEKESDEISSIVEDIFNKDIESAQNRINMFATSYMNKMIPSKKETLNHNLI